MPFILEGFLQAITFILELTIVYYPGICDVMYDIIGITIDITNPQCRIWEF